MDLLDGDDDDAATAAAAGSAAVAVGADAGSPDSGKQDHLTESD